ncbi:MAG TPA: ChbG/HpnK family deacetylase [Acidobacteriaceae bacterium]|nr:ChbG/HpnK family deacetylase [Acidobacteriaceae bacterium]
MRLILNADDFGLTRGINRAVGELAAAGALTSATLMASGAAFDDAVSVARSHPHLGVGCHIVLVDGAPISRPESIASLLNSDRRSFRPTLRSFLAALFAGRIRIEEIEREVIAQIRKVQSAGIAVTHIDTHKHVHIFPAVARPLLRAAEECGIRAVRDPFEPPWSLALHQGDAKRRAAIRVLSALRPRWHALPQIRDRRVLTTDGTVAISATGVLDSKALARILAALPDSGTYELCCHPGYNDRDLDGVTTRLRAHREIERDALVVEIPGIGSHPASPELIHFGDLT